MPLEYLTLSIEMPFMLLLGDMKQGIFYSMLLSFWLVFAGEHLMVSKTLFDLLLICLKQQITLSNLWFLFLTIMLTTIESGTSFCAWKYDKCIKLLFDVLGWHWEERIERLLEATELCRRWLLVHVYLWYVRERHPTSKSLLLYLGEWCWHANSGNKLSVISFVLIIISTFHFFFLLNYSWALSFLRESQLEFTFSSYPILSIGCFEILALNAKLCLLWLPPVDSSMKE